MTTQAQIIALNRFGYGARATDAPLDDPRGWLKDQLRPTNDLPPQLSGVPKTEDAIVQTKEITQQRRAARKDAAAAANKATTQPVMTAAGVPSPMTPQAMQPALNAKGKPILPAAEKPEVTLGDLYTDQVSARVAAAVASDAPFRERLVHFWANHFAVSSEKQKIRTLCGPFEQEAIRAHLDGSFRSMLMAVAHHPAMILYLDNETSFGPNSAFVQNRAGKTDRKLGLNENLGRELLELYSLGVRTGYTQADVTELARAITGWSVVSDRPAFEKVMMTGQHGFAYYPPVHEPGKRTILGKVYKQEGHDQGVAILADLGVHPATAHHVATKLARHFIADDPPPTAVAKLERVFVETDGDLPSLHRALVDLPEVWTTKIGSKYKTPWDYVISVGRLTGPGDMKPRQLAGLFTQLGQTVYTLGAPAGWPDTAATWLSSDGLSKRIDVATAVGKAKGTLLDARALATQLYGSALSGATRVAINTASSGQQALALLLASPEFMRR